MKLFLIIHKNVSGTFFFYCQFLLESDKSREKKFSEIASFLVFLRVHKTFTLRKISGKIIKIFSFTLNQQ